MSNALWCIFLTFSQNPKFMPTENQIIHDLFQIKGGGERLVLTACDYLSADLMTGFVGQNTFDLSSLPGQLVNLKALSQFNGIKTWQLAKAFKNHQPANTNYQNVIYSGVASPLAVSQYTNSNNVFYCHTPPRFIYDKNAFYMAQLGWLKQLAFKQLVKWFKPQYEAAVDQMNVILTNSNFVQKRIEQTLNKSAHVVYPPCDTNTFKWHSAGDYYLSLARHDELKRIDSIIAAFKQMPDKKLVIASGGTQTNHLKKLAHNHDNISFTGWLSDTHMKRLLGECLATIYVPLDEDFGMTPVESMSAGKPVICSDHGGLLETMLNEETGYFVSNESLEQDLIAQVRKLTSQRAQSMQQACESRAQEFDTKIFCHKLKEFL